MKNKDLDINNLLSRYFKGDLFDGEYEILTNLLNDKDYLDLFKKAKKQWEENPEQDPLALKNWSRVSYKISNAAFTPKNKTSRISLYKVWSYAAILIIGLILGILFKYYTSDFESVPVQEIAYNTPYGAKTKIVLPDSSIVWLNSGSELLCPSRFDNSRPVQLVGEAYFEVKKSKKPFVVSTQYGEVEVKGTSFNVLAYPDDNLFETTLVEGIVTLRNKEKLNEVTLSPGQQAVYENNKFVIDEVETWLFTSWKEGKLIFRNDYLPEVVKRLERWYNVKIELVDYEELSGISYTGTIGLESFSEVLQLLKVTTPGIDYSYNEKTRIIKITYNN